MTELYTAFAVDGVIKRRSVHACMMTSMPLVNVTPWTFLRRNLVFALQPAARFLGVAMTKLNTIEPGGVDARACAPGSAPSGGANVANTLSMGHQVRR